MVAGHETTSSTLAWLLYELSRRPDYQQKIREETKTARGRAAARGDESLTITDFESMTYTVAAMKVPLRLQYPYSGADEPQTPRRKHSVSIPSRFLSPGRQITTTRFRYQNRIAL